MTERNTLFRRLAAGVGAIALATVGLLGATNAYAEGDDGNGTTIPPVVNLGNIDATKDGQLVIHKSSANPGTPGDGTQLTPAPAGPLEGVKFTIKRVTFNNSPIDLTTYQGWVDAQGATTANVTEGTGGYGLVAGDGVTVETGSNGIATFNPPAGGDGFGLYYVEETDPGDNPIVSPVVPFLVAIPYPNDGGWLYTVHVYPKNKLDTNEPSKEVTDPGHNVVVGDTITWTITKTLPELAAGSTFNKLIITDTLDPRLSITAGDIKVTHDGTELDNPADYTVDITGQKVTITFTSGANGGLSKLVGGKDVVVTLATTVDSLGTSAVFENTATVNVNGAEHGTNTPGVYWGSVEVEKQDAANDLPLEGAVFEIYDGKDGTKVAGPKTTGEDGTLTFDGLWVGAIDDVVDFPADGMSRDYWLKEVQAAPGYVTPEGDAAWTKVTVKTDGTATVQVTSEVVENTKQDGPNLPQTGSTGSLMLVLVGLGLVGASGALFAARRFRTSH